MSNENSDNSSNQDKNESGGLVSGFISLLKKLLSK